MKRVTIYDVAKEAGVSLATVSRVINGSNVVKAPTKERVEAAVEKLGYKPNAIAQGLALQKSTSIGLVVPEASFTYTGQVINGLIDVAKIYNYNIMLHTITAGITANMAISGSIVGPILYFIITFGVEMALRYWLMYWSYDLGTRAIEILTKNAREFTHAASLLGVFIVGALTCNYGATSLGMMIPNGTKIDPKTKESVANFIDIQALLNGILPALIPLALTLMCYTLIKKKKWSPTKCIFLLLIIGVVGCALGIWAVSGGYKPLVPVPWTVSK